MSRLTLLFWQLMVAVVALRCGSSSPPCRCSDRILLPPFFFSNPVDVAARSSNGSRQA
jgi:NitT/TauT family transport system permease protein